MFLYKRVLRLETIDIKYFIIGSENVTCKNMMIEQFFSKSRVFEYWLIVYAVTEGAVTRVTNEGLEIK